VSQPYKQAAAASSFVMSGGVVAKAMAASTAVEEERPGRFYFNITGFPFPLGPFLERRTIRKEVTLPSSFFFIVAVFLTMSSL
jgi:hypothetical protein